MVNLIGLRILSDRFGLLGTYKSNMDPSIPYDTKLLGRQVTSIPVKNTGKLNFQQACRILVKAWDNYSTQRGPVSRRVVLCVTSTDPKALIQCPHSKIPALCRWPGKCKRIRERELGPFMLNTALKSSLVESSPSIVGDSVSQLCYGT